MVYGRGLVILDSTHTHRSVLAHLSCGKSNFGSLARHLGSLMLQLHWFFANREFGDNRLAIYVIALTEMVPVEH